MSYLMFHLVFIVPAILVAGWLARDSFPSLSWRKKWIGVAAIAAIAFVYTTPWDNFLLWRGVWDYGPDRVLGKIGFVPIEEYMFFVLQPVLTGLFLFIVLGQRTLGWVKHDSRTPQRAGNMFFALLTLAGAAFIGFESTHYLGLILVWAGPVLLFQWAYGGSQLWRLRRVYTLAVAIPTLYLCIADGIAIHLNVWTISTRFTTGIAFWSLPLEEALFFLMTNMLVVQGLLLTLIHLGEPQSFATFAARMRAVFGTRYAEVEAVKP
jgi:lycopene beta-cyclase